MADFLTRMAERTLGMLPVVQPLMSSINAPEHAGASFMGPDMDIQIGPIDLDSSAASEVALESPGDWSEAPQQVPPAPGPNFVSQPLVPRSRGSISAPSADLSASFTPRQQHTSPLPEIPASRPVDQWMPTPQQHSPSLLLAQAQHSTPQGPAIARINTDDTSIGPDLTGPASLDLSSKPGSSLAAELPSGGPSETRSTHNSLMNAQAGSASLLSPPSNMTPQQARRPAPAKRSRPVHSVPAQSSQVQHEGIQEPSRQDDVSSIAPSEEQDRLLIGGHDRSDPYERYTEQAMHKHSGTIHRAPTSAFMKEATTSTSTSSTIASASTTSSGASPETKAQSSQEKRTDILLSGLLVPDFSAEQTSGKLEMQGSASALHTATMGDEADKSVPGALMLPLHTELTTERTILKPTEQSSAASLHEEVSTPSIRVTIGRIDVRATPSSSPASAPTSRSRSSRPALSLDNYLKQRNGG